MNIKSGVIQGGILNPGEFNVFIDNIISEELGALHGINLGDISIASMLFADDSNRMSNTTNGLQTLLDTAHNWFYTWGIQFHPQMSNVLVLGVVPAFLACVQTWQLCVRLFRVFSTPEHRIQLL